MSQSIVIIPTYNEKGNIAQIIDAVLRLEGNFHVLVVDDNSPDGTAEIVKEIIAQNGNRLFLLERKSKEGLGTAYIAGFKYCLAKQYGYIFEMDADFSHNPKDLPRLREACENGADFSVGSRYVKGGKVSNWPLLRILISYFASVYVRSVLLLDVKDPTAGFVCYTHRVLNTMNLDDIEFVGYAFQIEMKYKAVRQGFKVKEVPITFVDRQIGQSKMSMNIFKEAFLGVLKMRFN